MILVFDRVENIVGKEETAGDQHFLLFPQYFQKASLLGSLENSGLCGKKLTLSQITNFRLFPNLKSLQTTIFNLMKVAESSPNG